mmetsp:Transcript_39910/g.78705  ORF Transcript_39910/g.78705 Transcript_39910/m.78705 type:complete len:90 (+) Transcript_39910:869-1138(+)
MQKEKKERNIPSDRVYIRLLCSFSVRLERPPPPQRQQLSIDPRLSSLGSQAFSLYSSFHFGVLHARMKEGKKEGRFVCAFFAATTTGQP